jgi:hypothetical protein
MKRVLLNVGIGIAIIVGLLGGYCLQQGGWMMLNPRYDQSRLIGLTSAQVIQRLGKPSHDPRVIWRGSTQPSWTGEPSDGPLVFGYYQGWATCRIEFENDRVVSVRRNASGFMRPHFLYIFQATRCRRVASLHNFNYLIHHPLNPPRLCVVVDCDIWRKLGWHVHNKLRPA